MKYFLPILSGLLCLIHVSALGDVIIVDPSGSADFTMIQAAINDSGTVAGDVVIVRPGTYIENINMKGKAITLQSIDPTDPAIVTTTIIDGDAIYGVITCNSGEDPNTIISGFVIKNGYTGGYGGGMHNEYSSPTVTHCTFSDNNAFYDGGGMYNYYSSPVVTDCIFIYNWADSTGGGMYNDHSYPTVTNCTFSNNTGYYHGGGMYNTNSSPTVSHCTFSDNMVYYAGGGMRNYYSPSTVSNCTFSGNTSMSGSGGGMENYRSSPRVTNCTFSDNAAKSGGGMDNSSSSPTVMSCTFRGNTANINGGGMNNYPASPTVINCAFSGNTADNDDNGSGNGGGMYNETADATVQYSSFCLNMPEDIYGSLHPDSESNGFGYCVQPPIEPELFGDSDGDGDVDMADFAAFAANWLVGAE